MTLQRFIERLIWLCMLPLIVLGTVLLLLHLHTLNERRQMLADSVVRNAARSLDQMLEVRVSSLHLLGRMLDQSLSQGEGELDRAQAYRIALEYVDLHGHHVVIGDNQYRMLINTRVPLDEPLPPLPRAEGNSALAAVIDQNRPAVGDMFVGPALGKPLVAMAVPLHLGAGQRLLLISTIETDQFAQRLSGFKLPQGWVLRVLDGLGQEILHTNTPEPKPPKSSRSATWLKASLAHAPWTVGLQASAISTLDEPAVRALLLLVTLGATVGAAYWGGRIAAKRLIRAMASLTLAVPLPRANQDIDEIAQVRTELRRLARRREALREAERRRIGLELHDDLQQKLALLRHDVDHLADEVRTTGAMASTDSAERLDRARGLVDETIEATHRLVQDLRPPMLQELGLPTALQVLADRHQAAHGQLVDFHAASAEGWEGVPEDTATALYRVAQEALNNARKHSGAHHVDMVLEREGADHVVLEICDDGEGFDARAAESSLGNGLRGMHERVQALSGHLELKSQPGQGTVILVRVPLEALPGPSSATATPAF